MRITAKYILAIAFAVLVACAGIAKAEILGMYKWNGKWPDPPPVPVLNIPVLGPPAVKATLAVPKPAAPHKPIPDRRNAAVLPPVEFDDLYTGGEWWIQTVDSQDEVRKNCPGATFAHGYALACKRMFGKNCLIIMAKPEIIKAEGYTDAIVMRHEMGHCNGWPESHAGARIPTAADWKQP